ncbi:MAG: hypothetical protein DRK00_10355 [Thermoprotei archaeon]|nr:MAG: hypothetical protein DRK00_10355 [Thermoprotei archaeon]
MFRDERDLARWLIEAIKACNLYSVKEILLGNAMRKKSYEDILVKYFGSYTPIIVSEPDIVLVIEDYEKITDEWLLVAIELKYFKRIDEKRWRKAYREVGQPLRYYIYGFDSAILWHVFEGEIDTAIVKAYSSLVGEVIKKLELPIVYFSTMVISKAERKFLAFEPLELGGSPDVCYIIRWMINYCRNHARNPLLPHDKEIVKRRKALKVALRIP